MKQIHYVVTPDATTAFPEADYENPWQARYAAALVFLGHVRRSESVRLLRLGADEPVPSWASLSASPVAA